MVGGNLKGWREGGTSYNHGEVRIRGTSDEKETNETKEGNRYESAISLSVLSSKYPSSVKFAYPYIWWSANVYPSYIWGLRVNHSNVILKSPIEKSKPQNQFIRENS